VPKGTIELSSLMHMQLDQREIEIQVPVSQSSTKTIPPKNTLAIVASATTGGSMKVYRDADNSLGLEFVEKLTTEGFENGDVIIIWKAEFWYHSVGDTSIKYLVEKDSNS
jgi:hypothetical protein